ncbi:hypothetical protein K1T71_001925 [Dendrolimus kikuchii]|uniref:Uncharacterized protein n=1 Tax=Dendrolimus kikuchii TaxID=765133 RepID=A0ACC1DFE4_9NEOP|nr:hypothetical protein K1T71_001925 [Dendrolimus kikuchii]
METDGVHVNNNHFEKPPWDVMKLYIKLYCQQIREKKFKHSKIMEAKKSWYSLSKAEQIQFYNKYKQYQMRWKEKIVDCIDKAEPFMKKIIMSVPDKDMISANEIIYAEDRPTEVMKQTEDTKSIDNDVTVEQLHNNTTAQECLNTTKKAEGNNETEYQNFNTTEQLGIPDRLHTSTRSSQEQELIGLPLVEPKPPMLKSGQELYELLAMTKDNSNAESWKNLSTLKKSRYNRAVLMLKKDYIVNYKLFLENLPPKDLYEYYHKTI